jgi:hypothetical protein
VWSDRFMMATLAPATFDICYFCSSGTPGKGMQQRQGIQWWTYGVPGPLHLMTTPDMCASHGGGACH